MILISGAAYVSKAHGNAGAYSIGTYILIGLVCAAGLYLIYKKFDKVTDFIFKRTKK